MDSDEIQLKVQRSLQEYEDAVENLDPRFAELGRASVAALDEFIAYWNRHPDSPKSRAESQRAAGGGERAPEEAGSAMREFVERQLEWAESEKERVLAQLSKR